ncbi:MAG: (2Fe-2S)-binding protein [Deltaproteobacteria bacterium]|nr:(2Fe-2S)-binding protein [Deltaproteobacteria bacterium]
MAQDDSRPAGSLSRRTFLGASGATAALLPVLGANAAPSAPVTLGPGEVALELELNGKRISTLTEPRETLADVLLYRLELTGTKVACDRGACGSCTVLVDGHPRSACMTPALDVAGHEVTTIEGLGQTGRPGAHRIQAALLDADGLQCGYCTPGFVVSAYALLERNAHPTKAEIMDALSGNLCRCGSHPHIIDAITRVAAKP